MKKFISGLITVFISACQLSSQAPVDPKKRATPTPSIVSTIFNTAWDDRSYFLGGLIESEQGVLNQLPGASVYHLDLQIADNLVVLEGQQVVRYTNQEEESLEAVYFRLFPNLFDGSSTVHSVKVDGQEVQPTFELNDSAMRVALPQSLEPSNQVEIEVDFSVDVPSEGGGNYGMFAYTDDILALAHFYPMIAAYDDEGWNLEIAPEYGDVVYADSSFYLVRVTAPADLMVVASGVELDRQTQDGQQILAFAGGPMRDFYIAASPRFAVLSERVGGTTINSYAPEELMDGAEVALGHAVKALEIFNDRFGNYPFVEFDFVPTPNLALGIEYPGIVAMAIRLYDFENSEYPPFVLDSVVAHEVAHQWFYSVVGNDQLDEPWLDEAMAQYVTLVYWGDLYGPEAAEGFRASFVDRWGRVEMADIPIGLPVREYSDVEYGAIVYGRGPLFIEAEAELMGQETFDNFLRDYYETHKWGIATTESLKELAETHCDCDLTQNFVESVYER